MEAVTYTNNSQNLFVKKFEIISLIKLSFSRFEGTEYKSSSLIQKYITLKSRVNIVIYLN